MCLEAQGKIDEAKEYQPSAPLPPEAEIDVEEAKNLHIRSLDMYNEGQYKEAEVTARKELRVRMEHSGPENDRAQTCLLLIAQALQEQDLHSDSQSLTRQVLAYRKRVFGWRSRQTHNALRLLAAGTRDLGELEEAEGYYRQLVLWKEATYGKLYMETCIARFDLAIVLVDQRKFDEAEKLFRLNLEIHLDDPSKCDPRAIAETYHNLGCVLRDQSRNAEAEACFQHAYDGAVELYGCSNSRSTNALALLATMVAEQGKFHDAEELYLLLGESVALPQSEDEISGEEDLDEEDSDEEDSDEENSDEENSDEENSDAGDLIED